MNALALVSTLVWWVLFGSIGAAAIALLAWVVLRISERANVVFNRVYLASLVWTLFSGVLIVAVAAHVGHLHPPFRPLLGMRLLQWALVLDMLLGAVLLWRLTPRVDAHRIRLGSACLAAAVIIAIGFGAATALL
ncbi:MAG: hypothetical protein EPN56_06105 [Rhodanobacter sp.]|nr:MAG: hypothetical protein EPN78_11630 [Rhodanobacter sp.]TAM10988.1 MAG: hypothetical protein EPN66_09070 [Rhodanobacter sp.]TAM36534.1 MAG: hypothetical protein EPN56_06105 [Rhodanobacter sp.]